MVFPSDGKHIESSGKWGYCNMTLPECNKTSEVPVPHVCGGQTGTTNGNPNPHTLSKCWRYDGISDQWIETGS